MLEVKLFEVRAEATLTPVLAVRLRAEHAQLDLLKARLSMEAEQLAVYHSQEQLRERDAQFSELAAGVLPALQILQELSSVAQEEQERWLLRKAGFLQDTAPNMVMFTKLSNLQQSFYDPSQQSCPTLRAAHQHAVDNWESLLSGQVIDVDFLAGERAAPRESERALDLREPA